MARQPIHSKVLLLFLFTGWIISTSAAWSQVEAIIKGKVINEKGTPVKNASIKVGNYDARTNSNGFFVVKNNEFPAQLTVNHPLYSEYLDMIVLPEKWRDTIRVSVVLLVKETQIEEVTVSAEQIFWVYPRKQANVLDFILQPDDGIVLCCSDEHNYYLRGLNPQGEKIYETPIRSHPRKLYRDCMKSIHLIYSDSIYETAIFENTIGIFQPRLALGLLNLIQSCVYKDSKTLIKYNYSKQDQRIEYTALNIQSKKTKVIYVGEDRAWNRQLREYAQENSNADDILFNTTPPPPPPPSPNPAPDHIGDTPGNFGDLKKARDRWNNRQFYELILIRPAYIPMFELNDSLIIFDHLNDSAVVFNKSGQRIRSFPIYYHYFKGWKYELVSNLEKTKIFARYESQGLTVLREINPTNGKIERMFKLEKHVFPEHLQIHGDFIYYIYKDYLDQSMHYIYKQHLE
nr:carboxypeptidase-like regulatory domain-containing protein [uncultured Fluviicola sp.]